MSRSCFCGENACSRCLNPRQLYEGNTGQYLAILGSTTIVGNRVLNASVLASKARHTSNYLLAQFGFTRHLQRYPFCLLPGGQTSLRNCTAKFKSLEPSYGKFSNKLRGGGFYRKWIQMFEKSLHTIKKPSTYAILLLQDEGSQRSC